MFKQLVKLVIYSLNFILFLLCLNDISMAQFCSFHADCDDGNVCTDDYCDLRRHSCFHEFNSNACDDGIYCNGNDTCDNGSCSVHSGDPCPGTSVCEEQDDICSCNNHSECDDENLCTDDGCYESQTLKFCIHIPLPDGSLCDDATYCNGTDTCNGGICVHSGNPCPDDGLYCNGTESCDEIGDNCNQTGNPCPEGLVCREQEDLCDECLGDYDCFDGSFCNGEDTCVNGSCVHSGNPCSAGTYCNDFIDQCECTPPNHTQCFDSNSCTQDLCQPCPQGWCFIFDGFCLNVPFVDGVLCDDGNYCNGEDACSGGSCSDHSGNPCSEGTLCNEANDTCTVIECTQDEDCDDGVFCNGSEICAVGFCNAGVDPCNEEEECDEDNRECLSQVQPFLCGIAIEPETAEVVSGESVKFSVIDTGECNDREYEWLVISTIDSLIDQSGSYSAGINRTFLREAIDVVRVVDHANSDISAETIVFVSWRSCLLIPLYGENSREVAVLRHFRDAKLVKTKEGKELIKLYYLWSPVILRAVEENETLKTTFKELIDEMLLVIEASGD